MQREAGDSGLKWVMAVILDPATLMKPLCLKWSSEQLTENFKVRYSDIDYPLALREAAEIRDVDWFDRESVSSRSPASSRRRLRSPRRRSFATSTRSSTWISSSRIPGSRVSTIASSTLRDLPRHRTDDDHGRVSTYPDDFDRGLQVLFATVRAASPTVTFDNPADVPKGPVTV